MSPKVLRGALSLLAIAMFCISPAARAQSKDVIKTVIIDAGHGGKDSGANFGDYKEKDIVLAVALRLGELINKQYPNVTVVYTRKTDVFVELAERGRIANTAGGDLFISVHVNSTPGGGGSGTETYVMGVTKGQANLDVAMRENDVIKFEPDNSARYDGYKVGSSESIIMLNLMQYSHREQSLAFANAVQQQYRTNVRLADRGVKEAGFLVLWRTAMPSVLTELGFINNNLDLKQLGSPAGRELYARSLFNAFSAYKTKADGTGKQIVLAVRDADTGDVVPLADTAGSKPAVQSPAVQPSPAQTVPTPKPQPQSVPNSTPVRAAAPQPQSVPAPSSPTTVQCQSDTLLPDDSSRITFSVQVMASATQVGLSDARFGLYRGVVFEKRIGAYYKYFVGNYTSYDQAVRAQAEVRNSVKDAFVVPFRGGQPIALQEALRNGK